MRLNHFVILGKNHFVSVVNKGVIGASAAKRCTSWSLGKSATHAKRDLWRNTTCANKNMIVTAIATELALHPATWDDSNKGTFERIKAKLTFKWPKTLID